MKKLYILSIQEYIYIHSFQWNLFSISFSSNRTTSTIFNFIFQWHSQLNNSTVWWNSWSSVDLNVFMYLELPVYQSPEVRKSWDRRKGGVHATWKKPIPFHMLGTAVDEEKTSFETQMFQKIRMTKQNKNKTVLRNSKNRINAVWQEEKNHSYFWQHCVA